MLTPAFAIIAAAGVLAAVSRRAAGGPGSGDRPGDTLVTAAGCASARPITSRKDGKP